MNQLQSDLSNWNTGSFDRFMNFNIKSVSTLPLQWKQLSLFSKKGNEFYIDKFNSNKERFL